MAPGMPSQPTDLCCTANSLTPVCSVAFNSQSGEVRSPNAWLTLKGLTPDSTLRLGGEGAAHSEDQEHSADLQTEQQRTILHANLLG